MHQRDSVAHIAALHTTHLVCCCCYSHFRDFWHWWPPGVDGLHRELAPGGHPSKQTDPLQLSACIWETCAQTQATRSDPRTSLDKLYTHTHTRTHMHACTHTYTHWKAKCACTIYRHHHQVLHIRRNDNLRLTSSGKEPRFTSYSTFSTSCALLHTKSSLQSNLLLVC